jgi:hypothetical protein
LNCIAESTAQHYADLFPHAQLSLQSRERAPKISAFMKFVGETGTVSKPSVERWALLFLDGFWETIGPVADAKKQILRFRESGGLHRSPRTGPRASAALGMTDLCIFRRLGAAKMARAKSPARGQRYVAPPSRRRISLMRRALGVHHSFHTIRYISRAGGEARQETQ